MYVPTASTIYEATASDAVKLWYLTQLTGQPRLRGRVLIGEIQGSPAAAISLADDRIIVDPYRDTARLTAQLRSRAQALRAHGTAVDWGAHGSVARAAGVKQRVRDGTTGAAMPSTSPERARASKVVNGWSSSPSSASDAKRSG